MMTGNIQIRKYMLANVKDHVDPLTGEVNNTSLAEDAFWHFEPNNQGDVPEKYFDCAFEIGERHEIATGVKTTLPRVSGYINSIPGGAL